MSTSDPILFTGLPGSPYTRKMLALLRYRHIPYAFLHGNTAPDGTPLPEPRVALMPTFYLPDDSGELQPVVDSTSLIRRFEAQFNQRAAIPPDPVLGFLNFLIEDYGDEWLTKAMFHYRWSYAADIDKARRILPRWTRIQATDAELDAMGEQFASRQIDRLWVVGSNEVTGPVIEASYRRFLALFDALIEQQHFLFGARPASADFALYAQLTQLAGFDPTPSALSLAEAPRVSAWVDLVDDLSGNPAAGDAWLARDQLEAALGEFLREIGRVYAPVLLANAEAYAAGEETFSTEVDANAWEQRVFPYQVKCLLSIREAYAAVPDADRRVLDDLLEGSGCELLLR